MFLFSAGLLACRLAMAAEPTYEFNIHDTSLAEALKEFAAQSGLQIAYFTRIATGRMAPAVSGRLTPEQALTTLLRASGLTYERIDKDTIAIRTLQSGAADEPARPQSQTQAEDTAQAGGPVELSEIVITGSHIRGASSDISPMVTIGRDDIQRSGYTNMMQLVEALPMNFKGGASGSTEVAQFGAAANYGQNLSRGTGFNLRGLGSASTLTLVNGRRIAPSAQGQFVDVSTIPLAAVERIEILTDGASAVYGADAVAGVVNIILRKDFDGEEAGLQYGSTTDGAMSDRRASLAVGRNWQSGNALFVGEYNHRDPLDILDRDYIVAAGQEGPTYLLPRRNAGSMMLTLDQKLPASFDFSTNLLYSYEEVDSLDTTPSDSTALSQTPITNRWSAGFELGYAPSGDWRIALNGLLGRTLTKTGFAYRDIVTGEPVLLIKDYNDKFSTWSMDLKADGKLFELPGGTVRLAIGGSYRGDDVISTRVRVIPPTGKEVRADDSRHVKSAFAELYVPIVGRAQELAWAKRIDLSLAARYDDYSDFGNTSNPKVALLWSPLNSLDLRASYSTSFRAPSVAEKSVGRHGQQISTDSLAAPDGSGEQIPIFYLSGSAPLDAEKSTNYAFGFTFRPSFVTGAELSFNYFDIDYKNRINAPPYDNGALSRPEEFGDLITPIADDAAAEAYLDQRIAAGDLYIDWTGTGANGVRYVYDLRQRNAARTKLNGYDITARYNFAVGSNAFDVQLTASHIGEILTSLTSDTKAFDEVDKYNQPLDWRLRGMGTWLRGGFGMTVSLNYADRYTNDALAEDVPIASWTTVDMTVSYDFSGRTRASLLEGVKTSLSVTNLTDRDPPRAISMLFPVGYDVFNADATGRFVSARLTKRW